MSRTVAVVTGAGSGIGRACAVRLAKEGFAVAVLDLNLDAANAVVGEIREAGGEATAVYVDVSDRTKVNAAMDEARTALGPIAVLVNNAGYSNTTAFMKITDEQWQKMLQINLTGTYYCCQAALPDMIAAKWGRIVNISSSSTLSGQPFMADYVAAKSGVNGLTKSLALEFGPKGITVNALPPGFIDTPMLRDAEARGFLGGTVEEHTQRTPVRRPGRPEDLANACAFLCREESDYITGQILPISGGRNT